ncbi:tyrosine-type recombinase/integrase [Streptomyces sp. NPDC007264]|uniref:tyrosine-type recombinase/integrase n=1 Tax=Streptomyces sp. NPDC007264 TaxID=3364777 RepID=UPI0036D8CA8D
MWETIIVTGRRASEVIQLRLDCVGRYGGLPLLWHDQTKVGNLNAAVRIPDHLLDRLEERRQKTLTHYADRHAGRPPTAAERTHLALFPTDILNPDGRRALSYTWFHTGFRSWIAELDLGGHYVAHQARHTLATRLLRHGASLTHIRRYLGQVSDRMAEHYVHLTQSDLENFLQHVWVAGPGTTHPGELLTSDTTPLTHEQAQALAIDLSRRSTPAEGGFCTFQPVVDGGTCPWNPRLPQLRQVRPVRRRPALLAAQARAVATAGRRRPRRRHRRLPPPLLRAHCPRHRRPGKGPGRPRPPRRGPRPGPTQTPGLLPSPMVHRLPRRRPRRRGQRRAGRVQRYVHSRRR